MSQLNDIFKEAVQLIYRGDLGSLRDILDKHPELLEYQTEHGDTLVHLAADGNSYAAAATQFLLERGMKPDTQNKRGITPAHLAVYFTEPEMLRILILHNAALSLPADIGLTASFGNKWHAVLGGDPRFQKVDFSGWSVLHYALYYGDISTLETLLLHGADTTILTGAGLSTLHIALIFLPQLLREEWTEKVVNALLERGAPVNHMADVSSYLGLVMDDPDLTGEVTPLDLACYRQSTLQSVTPLLAYGADTAEGLRPQTA